MVKDKSIIKDTAFKILQAKNEDYISLTDIAKYKSDVSNAVILNWMRNKYTLSSRQKNEKEAKNYGSGV